MAEVPVQNDAPVISESDLVSKVQIEPTTEKRPREEVFTLSSRLARLLPRGGVGGRLGRVLFQELVELEQDRVALRELGCLLRVERRASLLFSSQLLDVLVFLHEGLQPFLRRALLLRQLRRRAVADGALTFPRDAAAIAAHDPPALDFVPKPWRGAKPADKWAAALLPFGAQLGVFAS